MSPAVLVTCLRVVVSPLRLFCVLPALLFVFGPSSLTHPLDARAAARIPTTTYTTDTTWSAANSPYILDGTVTVASGATLTIEPGVVVKANGQLRELRVNGTLVASGTAGNRIVFTSIQDDSVGGDSGGDGATVGAPGQWYRIRVTSSNSYRQRAVCRTCRLTSTPSIARQSWLIRVG